MKKMLWSILGTALVTQAFALDDILPALNTIQTLIALKEEDKWVISVFQNTPAAFHALPELSDQMTAELRKVLNEINNN